MTNESPTITEIADGLSASAGQRFLQICEQLKSAGEEDEEFLIMEGIGILMAEMQRVPKALSTMLEEARRGLTDDQATRLGHQFSEILKAALELPAYETMREYAQYQQESHAKLQNLTNKLSGELGTARREIAKYARVLPVIGSSLISSFLTLALGAVLGWFAIPHLMSKQRITVPHQLWPYVELQKEQRLSYEDLESEKLRLLSIKGVLDVQKKGNSAILVIQLK